MNFSIGQKLVKQKEFGKALNVFSYLEKTTEDQGVLFYLGLIYFELNDYDKSIFYYEVKNDGFDLTASSGIVGGSGYGGPDYASWTFRKREKFFDIVTYTGDGTSGRQISHNLNATVGMILIKRTDAAGGWRVYHRGANSGSNPEQWYAMLQSTNPFATASTFWNNTKCTAVVAPLLYLY